MKSAIDEKMELLYHSPQAFVDAMNNVASSMFKGDDPAVRAKTTKLGQLIGETMQLADALGRKRLLMEVDSKSKREQPAHFRCLAAQNFMATPVVPHVQFKEAYEDILRREPRIAKSRDEIARAYSGDNGFAILRLPTRLASDARMKLLQRVQRVIADFAAKGESTASVRVKLSAIGDFTKSYAETIYRTNLATAFTAGRMKQMQDRDVQDVAPAFEFVTAKDSDVRSNHRATQGLIAKVDSPAWDHYAPPLGFNCRCDLRVVDRYELKKKGLLEQINKAPHYPPNIEAGGPDPGFRVHRTDKRVYGFKSTKAWEHMIRPWMIYG